MGEKVTTKRVIVESHIDRLKQIVSEIEDLMEKKKEIDQHISALLSSAELMGFSKKILKKVISIKNKTREEIEEEEAAFHQLLELLA